MGNLCSRLRCWVSSCVFILRFRVMRLMQYWSCISTKQPTSIEGFEAFAKKTILKDIYGFYSSGSIMGLEQTLHENNDAYTRYFIRPRFIRDTSTVDMSTTLLGNKVDSPICVAPTGAQCYLHWEGEIGTARACSRMKSCMILSAFSSVSLEDVARASGEGLHWFHLAITMPDDLIKEHVQRAEKAGYKALVITVDRPNVGLHRNNESIMNKSSLIKFANFSVSKTTAFIKQQHAVYFSQPITWDRIEWVRSLSTLPIVLKGILTAEDALLALEHKIEGIIVSNHGGRQLDCVPATIDVLEEIASAVGDKMDVYLDGGIRRGTDVFKALARGAKAVFIGRPSLWGLSYKGSVGVEGVLNIIKEELKITMQLAGCVSLSEIKKEMVVHNSYFVQA